MFCCIKRVGWLISNNEVNRVSTRHTYKDNVLNKNVEVMLQNEFKKNNMCTSSIFSNVR